MESFAIPFLLFVGALLAVQAAANVQLSTATGSPFAASTLQLGIGATLLLAAAAVAGSLDGFGWIGVPHEPLGPPEIAGGLAVLTGAALIVGASTEQRMSARLAWPAL